jgi:hypothetical protein
MAKSNVILRKWTGRIRSADQEEYGTYVARTGADDYSHTPGNESGPQSQDHFSAAIS